MMAGSDVPLLETLEQLPEDRVRLAAQADCAPATLHELARDPNLIVRATVALNSRYDAELDAILASDSDERVRALLGARVARLMSTSSLLLQTEAAEHIDRTLRMLAADSAVRVRTAIADELASTDAAPRDLILQLANDVSREVSDRVIRLSPLLSDEDLLTILSSAHRPAVAISVAGRSSLSAAVADAIVEQADAPTIRALLANQSACLREATLDILIGRAPNHVDWHAPLIHRPSLSGKAVRALSEFITTDLLRVLAMRTDLDPSKLDVVRRRLLAQTGCGDADELKAARQLHAEGRLTEAILLETAREGDQLQLLAQLSVASGIKLQRVERALELRSAKALVSLVWRSGFSMSLAVVIQRVLSHFGPDTLLKSTAEGGFPLSDSEMIWQIELLSGIEP